MQHSLSASVSAHASAPSSSPFAAERRERRHLARARIHRQVAHPIDVPSAIRDPLVRKTSTLKQTVAVTRLLLTALALHGLTLLFFFVVSLVVGSNPPPPTRAPVVVQIHDVPRPPPPTAAAEPVPEPVGGVPLDFTPPPSAAPEPLPPPSPPRSPKPRKRAPNKPKVASPTESESESESESATAAPVVPRRRVGLNLNSTVQGGAGPTFDTGDSRMGQTDPGSEGAVTAGKAVPTPAGRVAPPSPESQPKQRAASRIPTRDGAFVGPKRVSMTQPPFPPQLEAQRVEGDVLVRVRVEADGTVSKVEIAKTSGHEAFDTAARLAAFSERFEPARRNGEAVPYTLTYSYRFRTKR